jgi:Low affinity iron permease
MPWRWRRAADEPSNERAAAGGVVQRERLLWLNDTLFGKERRVAERGQRNSLFDRFAEAASEFASHAAFFIGCVLLVVVWAPSYFVFRSLNTWQLVINTATTIVTFLLVALLQNSQRRSEEAIHQKLDALADGLADLMEHAAESDPELHSDISDLRRTVGIEQTG